MSARGRIATALAAMACTAGLTAAAPDHASAHAYLIKTVPVASEVLGGAPHGVSLTFDEAVEPRFAIISVTDARAQQETVGAPTRSPADPDTLRVALRSHLPEGWYLVYWRAISVDGHPVQGAFTYAVGPNPGPAPQFRVPNIASSATSPQLLITRWIMFLSVMVAIGLFAFRFAIARPLARSVPEARLRPISVALVIASLVGVAAIPVYLDFAIAGDSLRSVFDLTALVPLYRVTAFGRGYLDMTLCFALFCLSAGISLWLDHPGRERRSIAELAAQTGALAAAAATLIVPGAAGHAAQQSPRGFSLLFDWLHLVSGSLWLGGLVGLLVLPFAAGPEARLHALAGTVPRFSNVALISVLVLLVSGTGQTIFHMPALDALWQTSYGVAILVKIGILLLAVMLASGNLLRARPQLIAATQRPELGRPAIRRLRVLVGGEAALVAGAVFVAAVLSSLAPPPPAFALQNSALAQVGPGRVAQTLRRGGYVLQVLVAPNRAATPDSFALRISRGGRPVRGADVTLTLNHLEMQMPQQEYQLTETRPGLYTRSAPALIMAGRWGLTFQISPKGSSSITALIVDQAGG